MIDVEHLSKHFGVTKAVDDISFGVGKGEVVGFLGPNGAGKTTTIRVLTGYHPATAGSAQVNGFDVYKDSVQVRRSIGYLAENVPVYPDLRVEEYLQYRAALKGVPRRERKAAVERAMERADIIDVRRKLCGHVSRGYRQRVGIADALVASPPILILDEPTSGLDPNQRRKVKELVLELAQEHTILFSSHILAEVEDVSSRVIIIDRGQIRADGSPDELLAASSGRRLDITAEVPASRLLELCGDLPGVIGHDVGVDTTARSQVSFRLAPGEDPSSQAGRCLHEARVCVLGLTLQLPSLEEYFAEVTDRRAQLSEEQPSEEVA